MRSSLRWLLAASLLLSVVALLLPSTEAPISAVPSTDVAPAERPAAAGRPALPRRLPAIELERATFDPFAGEQTASTRTQPAAPPVASPQAAPEVASAPVAPAISYRFLGRMIDPDGKAVVYLAGSGREIPVSVGTTLPEGYVVEAMDEAGIHLRYPPLDVRAIVSIPRAE